MDDDEGDDLYGSSAHENIDMKEEHIPQNNGANGGFKEEQMEDDVGDEGSDSDIDIITEKPEAAATAKPTPTPNVDPRRRPGAPQPLPSRDRTGSTDFKRAKSPTIKHEQCSGSAQSGQPGQPVRAVLSVNGKEGKDLPEVRMSSLDVNGTPVWPEAGKPITEVDFDTDLAEHSKPWRLPGTDLTDFFNYGLDEYTWTQYRIRQQEMADGLQQAKSEDAQIKAMLGGPDGGAGAMPGMGPGGGMPGIPDMNQMMQFMASQGITDPSAIDMNMMMQAMSQMGSGPPSGPGNSGPQHGGNFGTAGGPQGSFGGGNRGHHQQQSQSPHPQGGQGFQPPSGPGGQQGGGGMNMLGYSPQQIALMQQEQQNQGGGGGGGGGGVRGRGRRGRGFY